MDTEYITEFAVWGDESAIKNLHDKFSDSKSLLDIQAIFPEEFESVDESSRVFSYINNNTLWITLKNSGEEDTNAIQRIIKRYKGQLEYVMKVTPGRWEWTGMYINTDVSGKYFPEKIRLEFRYGSASCRVNVKNEDDAIERINSEISATESCNMPSSWGGRHFQSLDEFLDAIIAANEEENECGYLFLESFVDAENVPLWQPIYNGAYRGKLYRVFNGDELIDVVSRRYAYTCGEKISRISFVYLERALIALRRFNIEIFKKCLNCYCYSRISYIGNGNVELKVCSDHFNINSRDFFDAALKNEFLSKLMSSGKTTSYIIQPEYRQYEYRMEAIALYNSIFGCTQSDSIYAPVFLVSEYELFRFLCNTLSADRVYFIVRK